MCDFSHVFIKNKAKLLELFLIRKQNVLFTIGLYKILKLLNGIDSSIGDSSDVRTTMTSRKCWICHEKERLFKESFKERLICRGTLPEQASAEDELVELSWKKAETWINGESDPPDIFDEIGANLTESKTFWEDFFIRIQKSVKNLIEDPLITQPPNHDPDDFCLFFAKTSLNFDQLSSLFPIEMSDFLTNDHCSTVSIRICHKCLKQVLFSPDQSTRQLSSLTNHITSLSGKESANKCGVKEKQNNPPITEQLATDVSESPAKRITITLVRSDKKANIENRFIPVPSASKSVTSKLLIPAACNVARPLQVLNSSSSDCTGFSKGVNAVRTVGNTSAPSSLVSVPEFKALKNSKLVKVNIHRPKYKQTFNVSSGNSISNLKFKAVSIKPPKLVNKTVFSQTLKRFHLKSSVPKTFSKLVATKCTPISVLPKQMFPKNVFVPITTNVLSGSFSDTPLIITRPQKQSQNSKFALSVKPKETQISSKRTSKPEDGESGSPKKKMKQEHIKSRSSSSFLSPSEKSRKHVHTPQKSSTLPNGARINNNVKEESRSSLSKQRVVGKTTSKRAKLDKVPMRTIVANYLSRSKEKVQEKPFNNSTHRRRCRSKRRSVKNLIPVPYEAHYLCVHETIAKKGWKAYWYQKCRCARFKKKEVNNLRRSPRKCVTDPHNDSKPIKKENLKIFNYEQKKAFNTVSTLTSTLSKPAATVSKTASRNSNNNSSSELQSSVEVRKSSSSERARHKNFSFVRNNSSYEEEKQTSNLITSIFQMQEVTRELIENTLAQLDTSLLQIQSDANKKHLPLFNHKIKDSKNGFTRQSSVQKLTSERMIELASCSPPSDSLNDRRLAVENVAKLVMEQLRDDSSTREKVFHERFSRSQLFSQCFEEIDKQPGCMDIITVNPLMLEDYPELYLKAKFVEQNRNVAKDEYLKVVPDVNNVKSVTDNDLDSIWGFGRSLSYFSEKQGFNAKLKRTKAQFIKKPIKKIDNAFRNHLGFKGFPKRLGSNSLDIREYRNRLKLSKSSSGSQRSVAKKLKEKDLDFEPGIGPYIIPWDIPKRSISSVVQALEGEWEDEDKGFTGLLDECLIHGDGTLTFDQVIYALSALKENNEIFTFSSKPKEGKNTVLLIKRKVIVDDDLSKQNLPSNNGFTSYFHSSSSDKDQTSADSGKIRLKLRKTIEVSGSVSYEVPNSPSKQNTCISQDSKIGCSEQSIPGSETDPDSRPGPEMDPDLKLGCLDQSRPGLETDLCSKFSTIIDENIQTNSCSIENVLRVKKDYSLSPNHTQCDFDLRNQNNAIKDLLQNCQIKETTLHDLTEVCSPKTNEAPLPGFETDTFLINDLMHSTKAEMTDVDNSCFSSFYSSLPNFDCSVNLSDHIQVNPDEDVELMDWEGNVKDKSVFEEFLLSLDENSFEELEQVLFHGRKSDVLPLSGGSIFKCNRIDTQFDERNCEQLNTSEKSFNFDSDDEESELHSFDIKKSNLFDGFPLLDSPEVARGNACNKSPVPSGFSPLLSDVDLNDTSDSISTSSPDPCVSQDYVDANSLMRSCNVLLEPLEGVLEDLQRNGEASSSRSKKNTASKFPLSESSVRELNRLLKNRALNGAYWNSLESDSNSSQSSNRWRFRDRTKSKICQTHETGSENGFNEEEEDTDLEEEEEEPSIHYPKRKNRGRESYFRPKDVDLLCHIKEMSAAYLNQLKKEKHPQEKEVNIPPEDSKFPKISQLCDLLSSDVDLDEVRRWLLDASVSHPRPYSFLPPPNKKQSSRKQKTSFENENIPENVNKVNEASSKKSKRDKTDIPRNSSKFVPTPEFQTLRQRLFRLRHPDYTGSLCDENQTCSPFISSRHVKLYCVNADEACKEESPSISSKFIVGQELCPGRRSTPKSTSGLTYLSATSDPDYDRTVAKEIALSAHRRPIIKLKNHAVPPEYFKPPVSPPPLAENTPGSVFVSSRGRTIKPSLRNRPITYDSPVKKKRRISPKTSSPSKKPEKAQLTPNFDAQRPRFADKHSSSGSYIKKVLESGAYSFS